MENAVYDTNALAFIDSWLSADMRAQYAVFEQLLEPGDVILDGGCGSGRDTLYFLQQGYTVKAFDPSEEMVKYATSLTGIKIGDGKWEELNEKNAFNGVWASASLYHVARGDMADVFSRIAAALKANGILFCSFRDNPEDFSEGGRSFTSYDKTTFTEFINKLGLFNIIDIKEAQDTRKDKANEMWLYAFLRKK